MLYNFEILTKLKGTKLYQVYFNSYLFFIWVNNNKI